MMIMMMMMMMMILMMIHHRSSSILITYPTNHHHHLNHIFAAHTAPPSRTICAPVIHLPPLPANIKVTPTMSVIEPTRPRGVARARASPAASSVALIIREGNAPGSTALTVIFLSPNLPARTLLRWVTAAFPEL